jgi:hypothetical protein
MLRVGAVQSGEFTAEIGPWEFAIPSYDNSQNAQPVLSQILENSGSFLFFPLVGLVCTHFLQTTVVIGAEPESLTGGEPVLRAVQRLS